VRKRDYINGQIYRRYWRSQEKIIQSILRFKDRPRSSDRNQRGISDIAAYFASIYPEPLREPGTPLTPGRTLWLLLHSDLRRTVRVRRIVDLLSIGLRRMWPHLLGEAGSV